MFLNCLHGCWNAHRPAGWDTGRCLWRVRGGGARPDPTEGWRESNNLPTREQRWTPTNTDLHQHVHLCAQHHHLQRHCSHLFSDRFADIVGKTQAVYLLVGVSVEMKDFPASLRTTDSLNVCSQVPSDCGDKQNPSHFDGVHRGSEDRVVVLDAPPVSGPGRGGQVATVLLQDS